MKSKLAKSILAKIENYNDIIVIRHELPDYDALGSQFGLVTWIKDNFPKKNVYATGENHLVFVPLLYPKADVVEKLPKDFLLIIVDTANIARADGKELLQAAKEVIKIDHHPLCEHFGDIEYVDTKTSAASEILINMLASFKTYKFSKEAATYLYSGMVGDNGRFLYNSTTKDSFKAASKCLKAGVVITDIYNKMYLKSIEDIKMLQYLYNDFKITEHGVAYFHITDKALKEFNRELEEVKAFVNLFSGYKEIPIWLFFAEDAKNNLWRVSIRSRGYVVNEIASKHNGGGHPNASGAKAVSYEETLQIVDEYDNLIKNN